MKRRTFTFGAAALLGSTAIGAKSNAGDGPVAPVSTLSKMVSVLTLIGIFSILVSFFGFLLQALSGFRGLLSRPFADVRALNAVFGGIIAAYATLAILLVITSGSAARRSRGVRSAQAFQRRNNSKAKSAQNKINRINKRLETAQRKLDGQLSSVKDARSTVQGAKRDADRTARANRSEITDKDRTKSREKIGSLRAELSMYRGDITGLRGLGTTQANALRSHLRNAASIGRQINSTTNEALMYGRRMKPKIAAGDVDALDAYAPKFDALGNKLNGLWGQLDTSLNAANKAMGQFEGTQRKLGGKIGSSFGRISRDTGVRIGLRITF